MKTTIRLMVISILLMAGAPIYADDTAVQIFHCTQDDDATDDQLEAMASEWLKAARGMDGGENLEVYLRFPVVADMGEFDFAMIIVSPSFKDWGVFTDAYNDSPLEDVDDKFDDLADCPDSALYELEDVE